ncbi:MAG: hypothetical protein U0Z26_01610 [Anaerolineales bacterium]
MKHLSEEQLNEYLDHESQERELIEAHLSTCDECVARLNSLQAVFTELDSLPELAFTRDLATPVTRRLSLPNSLPTWLTLTIGLQATLAVLVAFIVAPIFVDFTAFKIPAIPMPSFATILIQVQSYWNTWLDTLSKFHIPTMPQFPVFELSSLFIMLTIAGAFMLWLVGNGLLLRNQIK